MQSIHFVKRAFFCLLGIAILSAGPVKAQSSKPLVYVGTYTGAKSKGIYAFRMEPDGICTGFQSIAKRGNTSHRDDFPSQSRSML